MDEVSIRPAVPGDGARVNAALAALSDDLGDEHRTRDADLEAALFGEAPAAHALIAEAPGETGPAGVAMFSPHFSTTRGETGLYVSDLWVASGWRGAGLGRQLLAAARDHGAARWRAGFLCLKVYADAPRSLRFYRGLGFTEAAGSHHLSIDSHLLSAPGGPR